MKNIAKSPMNMVIFHIILTLINFRFMIHSSSNGWIYLLFSLIYVMGWVLFIKYSQMKKAIVVTNAVMLVVSIIGFIVAKFSIDSGWFLLLVLILMGPFAGFQFVLQAPNFWLIPAIISIAFIITALKKK